MSEWRKYTLEELADDITVGFVGSMASEYIEGGIPFLRSLNVEPLRINQNDLKYISPEFHRRIKKSRLTPGDVVIVRTGKPGACAVVPAWLSEANCSDLVIVRCGSRIDNHFLAYYINTVSSGHVASHIVGAVQQHFNVGAARTLPVYLPPLDEQRAIVATLAAFDDKIELNRQMNETLEATARAIFKDWFVDFGPTRAKMAGTKPYLAPEIWKHFPDVLDDEGKPGGWQLRHLERFVEVNPIERLRSGTIAPYLEMAALPTSGPVTDPAVPRIFTSGMRFRNRDTLLARITPCLENGKTAYVQSLADEEVGWGSTEFIVFRARPPVPSAFTYLLARDPTFRAFAIQSMTGTSGRQRVNTEAISGYEIIDLPESLWRNLSTILEPLFNRIHTNGEESLNLVATRDLLLPKLMSGEISVKEAEKIAA